MTAFKKILMGLMVCAILASVSEASIAVSFVRTDTIAVTWTGAGDPVTQVLPSGSLVQLIWSADMAYAPSLSPVDISTTPGSAWGGGANDYLLYSTTTSGTGGWTGDLDGNAIYANALVNDQNINNGYVYAVIFSSGSPTAGSYYGFGQFANVSGNTTPPLPDASNPLNPIPTLDASPSGHRLVLATSYVNNTFGGYQVVPEPSSMALLGVGLALVAWRRMARK
jgi:hypothetical protein